MPGVVEGTLAFFRDYRTAGGTWKRYVAEPRKQLLVLRRLVERGRAAPPDGTLARVQGLPDVLFWKVLSFWRSSRDDDDYTPAAVIAARAERAAYRQARAAARLREHPNSRPASSSYLSGY